MSAPKRKWKGYLCMALSVLLALVLLFVAAFCCVKEQERAELAESVPVLGGGMTIEGGELPEDGDPAAQGAISLSVKTVYPDADLFSFDPATTQTKGDAYLVCPMADGVPIYSSGKHYVTYYFHFRSWFEERGVDFDEVRLGIIDSWFNALESDFDGFQQDDEEVFEYISVSFLPDSGSEIMLRLLRPFSDPIIMVAALDERIDGFPNYGGSTVMFRTIHYIPRFVPAKIRLELAHNDLAGFYMGYTNNGEEATWSSRFRWVKDPYDLRDVKTLFYDGLLSGDSKLIFCVGFKMLDEVYTKKPDLKGITISFSHEGAQERYYNDLYNWCDRVRITDEAAWADYALPSSWSKRIDIDEELMDSGYPYENEGIYWVSDRSSYEYSDEESLEYTNGTKRYYESREDRYFYYRYESAEAETIDFFRILGIDREAFFELLTHYEDSDAYWERFFGKGYTFEKDVLFWKGYGSGDDSVQLGELTLSWTSSSGKTGSFSVPLHLGGQYVLTEEL